MNENDTITELKKLMGAAVQEQEVRDKFDSFWTINSLHSASCRIHPGALFYVFLGMALRHLQETSQPEELDQIMDAAVRFLRHGQSLIKSLQQARSQENG